MRGYTARANRTACNERVGPTFGNIDVTTLTTLAIEEASASQTGATSTRIDALYLSGALCMHAVKGGIIAANPYTGVERRKSNIHDSTGRTEPVRGTVTICAAAGLGDSVRVDS